VTEKTKYSKALGKRIRNIREEKNISIKDFEAMDNNTIDRHALSRIENGQVTPSVYTLFKICKALGISQSQLFNEIEKEIK
jgi:transcriptional regulator with XRE-family HTH domain